MIAGCEAAWSFFGGVFKVLIPDNLKAVVTDADAVNPRLSVGWLDYAQHVGFATDPARVRPPQDKPRVERAVQYVRGNFWAGDRVAMARGLATTLRSRPRPANDRSQLTTADTGTTKDTTERPGSEAGHPAMPAPPKTVVTAADPHQARSSVDRGLVRHTVCRLPQSS